MTACREPQTHLDLGDGQARLVADTIEAAEAELGRNGGRIVEPVNPAGGV